jgi:uncharacterized protein DUF3107
MEVSIGVLHTAKELSIEMDGSADDVAKKVDAAVQAGTSVLWLTDTKGRRVGVSVDKIAYIEIADDDGHKRVGFGRG